jgi:hypothetical protein
VWAPNAPRITAKAPEMLAKTKNNRSMDISYQITHFLPYHKWVTLLKSSTTPVGQNTDIFQNLHKYYKNGCIFGQNL